ncbi:unnamed protein product [Clonostachys rosea]|uniref:Inhibitor of growth protein N-terminal histone-binding domain-containing protein n=1 Tax=Bionectria ochroleuca TaxID=29856 RepID=A0ABY6UME5_BIOOC|nr:unnamed protein product [Clonostachys rosea]
MEGFTMSHDEAMDVIKTCLEDLRALKAEIEKLVAEKKGYQNDITDALAALSAVERSFPNLGEDRDSKTARGIMSGANVLISERDRYAEDIEKINDKIGEKKKEVKIAMLGDWAAELSAEEQEQYEDEVWRLNEEIVKIADDGLRLRVDPYNPDYVFRDEETNTSDNENYTI